MGVIQAKDDFEKARNHHILTIIRSMQSASGQWDEYCEISIGWIGDDFIHCISNESEDLTKQKLDDIFSMCFRFLFELYLSIKNDLGRDLESARIFAFKNIDSFEQGSKEQIEYAIRSMPISIFKSIVNSESIQSIKRFNDIHNSADTKRDEWEKELSGRENRVNALKEALSTYESGFNFVGLVNGFNDLSKEKQSEKDNLILWLKVLGCLIILPLIAEVIFLYLNLDNLDKVKNVLLLSIIPTISLVGILIYYFRVVLFNYKAAKSQLLQIELRKTLCQFIQNYSEYSSEIKQKDKGALEKFENIIFSGIVSDDEKLPTTFDVVEQLGKFIKSIRS